MKIRSLNKINGLEEIKGMAKDLGGIKIKDVARDMGGIGWESARKLQVPCLEIQVYLD